MFVKCDVLVVVVSGEALFAAVKFFTGARSLRWGVKQDALVYLFENINVFIHELVPTWRRFSL